MPLVFVHGVNVRSNPDYVSVAKHRDSMFRRFALKHIFANWEQSTILNPYWGNHAAAFAFNCASLPSGDEVVLGGVNEETAIFLSEVEVVPDSPGSAILTTGTKKILELPSICCSWPPHTMATTNWRRK